jgi:serine/threonine-protein kinase RsbW
MPVFEADILATSEAISGLTDRIFAFLEAEGVDTRAAHHVALVVEELVTNLGKYGNGRDSLAKIRLAVDPGEVRGEIVDTGPAFDPLTAPAPNLNAPIADRPIGGLGLHLVRKFTRSLEYSQRDNENLTRFTIARS